MYLMFLAAGDDGRKVHLVEWKSSTQRIDDIEEEFERALDAWSVERPWMGNWTLVLALTTSNGGKIVPVASAPSADGVNIERGRRIMRAVTYNLEHAEDL